MKNLKSPFSIISKILIITGFVLFFIFYIFYVFYVKEGVDSTLLTPIIPISIGIILLSYTKYKQLKFSKLEKIGLAYDTTILKIVPIVSFKISGYFTFYIEGKYTDDDGKEHLVKSCLYSIRKSKSIIFLNNTGLSPEIDFLAKTYVDPIRQDTYYVQVKGELKSNLWFN